MRIAEIVRKTKETDIKLLLDLDGKGESEISTGVGFMDHMLTLLAVHAGFDLKVACKGDTEVDDHHTVEDLGIALGEAIAKALGDKRGIRRYGFFLLPMDEALAEVALDFSGRPYLEYDARTTGKTGDFDTQLIEEFFRALSSNCGLTLHIRVLYGANRHHKIEAVFKAFARSAKEAVEIVSDKIPSSKGMLQ